MKLTKSDAEKREEKKMKNSLFFFLCIYFSFFIHKTKWHIHIHKGNIFTVKR